MMAEDSLLTRAEIFRKGGTYGKEALEVEGHVEAAHWHNGMRVDRMSMRSSSHDLRQHAWQDLRDLVLHRTRWVEYVMKKLLCELQFVQLVFNRTPACEVIFNDERASVANVQEITNALFHPRNSLAQAHLFT